MTDNHADKQAITRRNVLTGGLLVMRESGALDGAATAIGLRPRGESISTSGPH